ncbi:MAG: metal-dependent hydrolase [Polaromonas sp.]|nr:metal-dependent hydrolase [Polaromonas sp.]
MQRLLQFTLDLFGTEIPAPLPAQPRKPGKTRANRPPAHAPAEKPAIETVADVGPLDLRPAQTLQQVLAPATYRHPAATREVLLGDIVVAYQFRRGKRRTIGFSVGAEGLVVSAPKWVPLYEIDKAVQEKAGWIVAKLQETRARHDRLEAARIEWRDGTTLPFLGETVRLQIDPRHAFGGVGGELRTAEAGDPDEPQKILYIGLAHDASAEQIRDSVQAWLMRRAKLVFTERLNHFSPHLGVQWRKLSLSSAGTRWGSASADGAIRLNWRLIHFRLSVIDYVVVHELSHLRVMDHSPRFWDTVRTVVPDYAELRSQLKDEAMPRW